MIPRIPTEEELKKVITEFKAFGRPKKGGFKVFYPATLNDGTQEALKLAIIPAFEDVDATVREDLRDEIRRRVEREIKLLGLLSSPHIVKLGTLSPRRIEIGGFEFIAYTEEYLPGDDLNVLIQSGYHAEEKELRVLALGLFDAISNLWVGFNTVHRDIKPLNVIKTTFTERPFVLLDLGLAFSIYESALTVDPQQRFPPGTTRYLAPEMLNPNFRDTLDYRADLYDVGMTLYEFGACTHPLARDRDDVLQTLSRILHQVPIPLEQVRPDLTKEFTAIVNQLLKKLPALRPSNLKMLQKLMGARI